MTHQGVVYGDVDVANDIWDKITRVTREVDLTAGVVRVAEQNFTNQKWANDNYAREIDLVIRGSRYWLLDAYLLGWKHILSVN